MNRPEYEWIRNPDEDDPVQLVLDMKSLKAERKRLGDRLYKGIMAARVVGAFLQHFGGCPSILGPHTRCEKTIGHDPPHQFKSTSW